MLTPEQEARVNVEDQMSKIDGGPAFPQPLRPADPDAPDDETGMSLRDYFAGQVLANAALNGASKADLTRVAYDIADAMLKRRAESFKARQ